MSSGGTDSNNVNEEKLLNLRAILGNEIPRARLTQVLEASNGSLEHAIEIYFHQKHQHQQEQEQEQDVKANDTNARGECSPIVISVENEPETISNHRNQQPSEKTRKSEIPYLDKNDDNNTNIIVNNKRNPQNISSPNNSEKRAATKQARLDSFFRVDANNGPGSPFSIGAKKDRKADITNDTRKESDKNYRPDSDCSTGIHETTTNTPATADDVLDSSPEKSSTSKIISIPAGEGIASEDSYRKNDNYTANPTSFVSFRRLCETLQEMTDTTKRLEKLKALETLIREIVDSKTAVNIDSNLRAKHDASTRVNALSSALELVLGGSTSTPLNVSGSAVSKALQTSLGITRNQISKAYRQHGDLGDCAASFFQKNNHFFIASSARRQLSVLQVAEVSDRIL